MSSHNPAATAMTDFSCPNCDTRFAYKQGQAGLVVACPSCASTFRIPNVGPTSIQQRAAERETVFVPPQRSQPPGRANGSSSGRPTGPPVRRPPTPAPARTAAAGGIGKYLAVIIGLSVTATLMLSCIATALIYRLARPHVVPAEVAVQSALDTPPGNQVKSAAEKSRDGAKQIMARVDASLAEGDAAMATEHLLAYLNSPTGEKEEAQALLDEVRRASSTKLATESLSKLSPAQLQEFAEKDELPADISFSRPDLSKLLVAEMRKTLPEEQSRREGIRRQQQAEQARLQAERVALLRETLAREQAERHQQLLRSRYLWSHPEGQTAHNWTMKSKNAQIADVTNGKSPTPPSMAFGVNTSPMPTLDGPGSTDIYIEIDPKVGFTQYAGLKFTRPCMLGIQEDFTVFAERANVEARDGDKRLWKSRAVELGDKQVFAFFPAESP